MKRLMACGLITLSLFVFTCSKNDDLDQPVNEAPEVSLNTTQEILQLVNLHRQSLGKQNLQRSTEADKLAEEHTYYMIDRSKISHDNFAIRFAKLQEQVLARSAGENVAFGQASAKTVMDAWINSAGHRANIEGDYTHIGIAAIKDESGRYYYTQLFYR